MSEAQTPEPFDLNKIILKEENGVLTFTFANDFLKALRELDQIAVEYYKAILHARLYGQCVFNHKDAPHV